MGYRFITIPHEDGGMMVEIWWQDLLVERRNFNTEEDAKRFVSDLEAQKDIHYL